MSVLLHLTAISGDCAMARRALEQILHGVPVLDLGPAFAGDAATIAADPDGAFDAALNLVGAAEGDVVTIATLPSALQPLSLQLNAALAATLGVGLVVAQDWADEAAVAVASAVARQHHAQVVAVFDGQSLRLLTAGEEAGPEGTGIGQILRELTPGCRPVIPADRDDLVLGLLIGLATGKFPRPASVVVEGEPAAELDRAWRSLLPEIPLRRRGDVSAPQPNRAQLIDASRHLAARPTTPLLFQRRLLADARKANAHIVLPEGNEPRILKAAAEAVAAGAGRLTLLGSPEEVRALAAAEGLDLGPIEIIDPVKHPWRDRFADEYAVLRAKKGVTREQAYEKVADVSYFGTMMVHDGLADGMVSGAVHTTAHTIRPAFEIIKTKPGISVVSSSFLMCLADRVLVFGDCAVNPNPTPAQLADIAAASAATAEQFGIEPRVAMLTYSTGTSGKGPDVDAVVEATGLLKEAHPELAVDGPLQFDAALDPVVAKGKAPGSPVAGAATVLIFPDLASGNIAYKAVQRTAGAVAIGPALQGLNKPVNDLSRGALVEDIVNTIYMTGIQAG